ncbi:MAG: thermopsin [Candidatus Marsarchaeota archaeon]|nr:thermopsin [Candidatus Marsarchaeota archaeon]
MAFCAFALGVLSAYGVSSGYYSYIQMNTTIPSTIALGYSMNYSGTVALMDAGQYANFVNETAYSTIYMANVSAGSYVVLVNVSPGSYFATIQGANSNGSSHALNFSLSSFTAPQGHIRSIDFWNTYSLPIILRNYSSVQLEWMDSAPLKMAFPNSIFANNFSILSNATSVMNYTWLNNRGTYNLTLTSPGRSDMLLYMNSTPVLVNPLNQSIYNTTSNDSYPVGISSYGLSNSSGNLGPYQIKTDGIGGYAVINSVSAYNATARANASKGGASLQLNAVMNIVSGGKTYAYWLQDALLLNTSNMTYSLADNIWNSTAHDANMSNGTVLGGGYVSPTNSTNSSRDYYAQQTNSSAYTLPLVFSPVMKIQYYSGRPEVSFGVDTKSGTYYFDNVTFNITSDNAYFLLTPYYMTPGGTFYDFEFVFGGEANGATTAFNEMSSSLWLYYYLKFATYDSGSSNFVT